MIQTIRPGNYIVKCPWCKSQFAGSTLSNCSNCGGTIEYQKATNELGPKPPLAPRELPKKFVRRVKYTSNVYTILGMVFTIPFFWSVVFPIIGIFLWRRGIKDANKELIPLQNGAIAKGEITDIRTNYSVKINNESPTVIKFTFEAGGQKYTGDVGNIFDRGGTKHVGDPLWVVYMPEDPSLSSIWPPLS